MRSFLRFGKSSINYPTVQECDATEASCIFNCLAQKITGRSNNYLRTALVESSWIVIRKDPALLMLYKKYCNRMDRNIAIIRIAKHLLSRISYVLKNQKEYVTGVVA